MGYRIRYDKPKHRKIWLTIGFFALFLAFAWYFAGDDLKTLVFPKELDELIRAIEQGSDLSDAVSAFCQEILDGPR